MLRNGSYGRPKVNALATITPAAAMYIDIRCNHPALESWAYAFVFNTIVQILSSNHRSSAIAYGTVRAPVFNNAANDSTIGSDDRVWSNFGFDFMPSGRGGFLSFAGAVGNLNIVNRNFADTAFPILVPVSDYAGYDASAFNDI